MNTAITVLGVAILLTLAAIDAHRRVVPNRIVLPGAGVVLVLRCTVAPGHTTEWLAAAGGTAALLLVFHLVYPPGLGMGDVKLGLLLGALLGSQVVVALLLGSVAAALVGLALVARHGAAARKLGLPFAPYLAAGAMLALVAPLA